jgi:hypothetical protein
MTTSLQWNFRFIPHNRSEISAWFRLDSQKPALTGIKKIIFFDAICHYSRTHHLMRTPIKYSLMLVFLMALVYGTFVYLSHPKPVPPLPFDTNRFVSTKTLAIVLQPHPTLLQRIGYSVLDSWEKLSGSDKGTWAFPAEPLTNCTVQVLLNDCMNASGARYLMPLDVTCGIVQFGHTNTLDGPQYVSAVEDALQHTDVGWWQQATKKWRKEHLVLLRFPQQKTVVVLPESEVADFERTNGIDPRGFGGDNK